MTTDPAALQHSSQLSQAQQAHPQLAAQLAQQQHLRRRHDLSHEHPHATAINSSPPTTAASPNMMLGHELTHYRPTLPQSPMSPPAYPQDDQHMRYRSPSQGPFSSAYASTSPTISDPSSASTNLPARITLPEPSTLHRLRSPVRFGLPDALAQGYLHDRSHYSQAAPAAPPSSKSPASVAGRSYSSHSPSITSGFVSGRNSSADAGQPSYCRRDSWSGCYDHYHSSGYASKRRSYGDAAGAPTSPSPLPSPTLSTATIPPDFQVVGSPHRHIYGGEQQQHGGYHPSPQRSQRRFLNERKVDLSSPLSASDMELGPESSILPPLFPSSPPSHSTRLPPVSAATGLSPVFMTSTLSGSSTVSTMSNSISTGLFVDPMTDHRAMSPPLSSTQAWSSKHHHPRIPIRSPDRDGQGVLMTSNVETTSSPTFSSSTFSSPTFNMNYFHIYQQNPRLLRPQGGRHDERRLSGSLYHQASGTSVGENVRPTATTDSNAVHTSHSHLVFNSPKTNKIAPEDIQLKREDEATKKGSDAAARSVSSSSLRPYSMSISNLLSNDSVMSKPPQLRNGSDHRYTSGSSNSSVTNGSTGGSVGSTKRKKVSKIDQDVDGEPPKRRRMSKKRAAELGLLDADGNIMKKRKRTKKMHDSDHVSPSGFRHGGERVVQEPDGLVVLAPDVGPVSMLDTDSLPPVVWKGHPLSVVGKPGYEQLHPYEEHIASTLRLSPAQYLNCKRTLILASREYHATPDGKQFRKSDAQKLCRIDVNKTSRLWEVFAKIGWLEGISEKDI